MKLLTLILTLSLCVALAACGSEPGSPETSIPTTTADPTVTAPEATTAETQPTEALEDPFQRLYAYILNMGCYSADENIYYVENQDSQGTTMRFVARNDTLRYVQTSETASYVCEFFPDKAPEFSYTQEVPGEYSAKATGQLDDAGTQLSLPLTDSQCTGCTIEDHYEYINNCQQNCIAMVKEITAEGSLPVSYEDLLG